MSVGLHEQRRRVGTDPEERGVTERHHAGERPDRPGRRAVVRLTQHGVHLFVKVVQSWARSEFFQYVPDEMKEFATGELEAALRDFRADVAVHSAKDLPSELPADKARQ